MSSAFGSKSRAFRERCVFAVNVEAGVDGTSKCLNFEGMDPLDRIKAQLMDAQDLDRTLNRMARQIVEQLDPDMDVARASYPYARLCV